MVAIECMLMGVFSANRFKVSFPWARKSEEALERQYIKTHYKSTSNEETAGNLWVDPTDGEFSHLPVSNARTRTDTHNSLDHC